MTLYVARRSNKNSIRDSTPCVDCYNFITQIGIKKVVYSMNNGVIVKRRIEDLKPYGETLGRRFINKGYKKITRHKLYL